MTIIRESKRDDLLLPYLQLVRQHGIDLTLGQFKSYMLELLASKGGIHNLSLSSNYYLAGVTKYYFNGDLTLNKDLAVYKGDFSANDQWNEDVCNRLNALILILRNAYIDTVGEKFEIEEDFGTLSLPKLLRKYNKKINDELGIVNDTKKKGPEKEEKVYDHNVGNGYTYDILYSYNQGTKYERYTAPGSWCITYGEHHYNYYIKNLGGIHYVIFLKNGYQKIERKVGPGYTRRKPHDKYGNSMIALLQKNNSWEPTYITSRWNHGSSSDGTEGTEADHAYTLEEFVNITGVSVDDLKRIWQEWNENKTVAHRELDPRKAELREEKKQVLRKLKYAQMRFNGGELPENLFYITKRIAGNPGPDKSLNFRKGIFVARLKPLNEAEGYLSSYKFVIDRGKILFDTLSNYQEMRKLFDAESCENYYSNRYHCESKEGAKTGTMQNVVIITTDSGYMLYDIRKKDYVTVDGVKKFKYLPNRWTEYGDKINPLFYTVALRGTQMAFIFCSNNQPLRLPNGQYWFSEYNSKSHDYRYRNNEVKLRFAGFNYEDIIEIVYDSSSREKYFFSVRQKRFIETPDISDCKTSDCKNEIVRTDNISANGFYGLKYRSSGWYSNNSPSALFNENNERTTFAGLDKFVKLKQITYGEYDEDGIKYQPFYFAEISEDDTMKLIRRGYKFQTDNNSTYLYDGVVGAFGVVNGYTLPEGDYNSYSIHENYIYYRVYMMDSNRRSIYVYYIYDMNNHGYLINPCGYPTPYVFEATFNSSDYDKVEEFKMYKEPLPEGTTSWNDTRTPVVINLRECKVDDSTVKMGEREKRSYDLNMAQNASPAVSLAEGDIRKMVAEAIKKITTSTI